MQLDPTGTTRRRRRGDASPVEPLVVTRRRAGEILGGIGVRKVVDLVQAGVLDEVRLNGMAMVTTESVRRATRT